MSMRGRAFTGLLNDSLAYITELYNEKETSKMRRHEAIDVGARKGTRILAPFSGIAYTMETELGGLAIATEIACAFFAASIFNFGSFDVKLASDCA